MAEPRGSAPIRPASMHLGYGGFRLTLAGFERPFDLLEALARPLRQAADTAGPGVPPRAEEEALRRAAESALGVSVSVAVAGSHVILRPLAGAPAAPDAAAPTGDPTPTAPVDHGMPPLLLRQDQRVDTAF